MQRFICVGNLTKDPETGETPSGLSVCKFSIAVNRDFTKEDGTRDVDFFNVVTWRGLADNCARFLQKGNKVAIVGKLQNRQYEAKDGTKRNVTEIIAEQVEFLTPKQQEESKKPAERELTQEEIDNLPF
nr:MAG TPA: Single strand binding protein [Caudoviricetes sp.]